jgi:hypothetical protein
MLILCISIFFINKLIFMLCQLYIILSVIKVETKLHLPRIGFIIRAGAKYFSVSFN